MQGYYICVVGEFFYKKSDKEKNPLAAAAVVALIIAVEQGKLSYMDIINAGNAEGAILYIPVFSRDTLIKVKRIKFSRVSMRV